MPKKIPLRRCIACREMREKSALLRVVRTPEGQLLFDTRGKVSGRGAYICGDAACFERALKSRALERALDCAVPPETVEALRRAIAGKGSRDG